MKGSRLSTVKYPCLRYVNFVTLEREEFLQTYGSLINRDCPRQRGSVVPEVLQLRSILYLLFFVLVMCVRVLLYILSHVPYLKKTLGS